MDREPIMVLGGLILFLALIQYTLFLFLISKVIQTLFWAQTPGTLLHGELEDSNPMNPRGGRYKLNLEYEFVVNDKRFTGSKASIFDPRPSKYYALKNLLDRCRNASPLMVYYNPENEKQCVLFPPSIVQVLRPLVLGVVFTLVSLLMLVS